MFRIDKIRLVCVTFLLFSGVFLAGIVTKNNWEGIQVSQVATQIAPNPSEGNPLFEWNKTWGGSDFDTGKGIWTDSEFVYMTGTTYSFGAGAADLFLVKYDKNGNQIWYRTWGGTSGDGAESIWGDDDYLYTVGSTSSYSAGSSDLLLIKWDKNGNVLWYRTWGSTAAEGGTSIWGNETVLYTGGNTRSYGAGGSDGLIVKWDKAGNDLWFQTFGNSTDDDIKCVFGDQTSIYAAGVVSEFDVAYDEFDLNGTVIKFDSDGNQLWNRTWGSARSTDVSTGVWVDSNAVYISGHTESYGSDYFGYFLQKRDKNGNELWYTTWDTEISDESPSLWGDDVNIYLAGVTEYTQEPSTEQAVFIKWDKNGNQKLNCSWDVVNMTKFFDIVSDGAVLYCTGQILTEMNGYDALLSKLSLIPSPILADNNSIGNKGKIALNWSSVAEADSYSLYRSRNTITGLGESTTLIAAGFTDTDYEESVSLDGIWYYAVVAVNTEGNSPISNIIAITVDLPEPDAPILETPETPSTDGNVILNWNDVLNADYYSIYISNNEITDLGTGVLLMEANIEDSTYTITDLEEGTWYFVVTASNATGESDISNCESIVVDLPAGSDDSENPSSNKIDGFNPMWFMALCLSGIFLLKIGQKRSV